MPKGAICKEISVILDCDYCGFNAIVVFYYCVQLWGLIMAVRYYIKLLVGIAMELISLLEKKRTECGLTYTEFCHQIGINPDYYRELRRHKYEVGATVGRKIENWLNSKEAELNEIRTALMS